MDGDPSVDRGHEAEPVDADREARGNQRRFAIATVLVLTYVILMIVLIVFLIDHPIHGRPANP